MKLIHEITNSFVSVAKGLRVTLTNWSIFRPSVTELYPEIKPTLPENYRGMPSLPYDPKTGRTKCIGCGLCARMCPEDIIKVVMDKSDPKDRKPAEFEIDIQRCMWCGLCMEVCPTDALRPARTFELACRTREGMHYDLEALKKLGGELPPEPEVEEEPEEVAASDE